MEAQGAIADYTWNASHYNANADAEFSRWQPILDGILPKVQPCEASGGTGQPVAGWTCANSNQVFYCDDATKCMSTFACPGGCVTQPNPTPDLCH